MSNDLDALPLQLNEDHKAKVKHAIEVGIETMRQIADLREGLRETVKEVAEEIEVKPALINKAIRAAFKDSVQKMQQEVDDVEVLLHAAGRA